MNNTPINYEGKTRWLSRSIAAVCYVYGFVDGKLCILANQRGTGTKDRPMSNPGKWNCPSGFLDYDETIEECACREIYEETGVVVDPSSLSLMELDSDITRRDQNVLARYSVYLNYSENEKLTSEHSEENEVVNIKWIPITDVDNYEWVSEKHVELIKEYAKNLNLFLFHQF